MGQTKRAVSRPGVRSFRYGIVAIALCAGFAGAPIQGIAWADSPSADSTSGAAVHAGTKGQAKSDQPETRGADPDPDAGINDTEADESPDAAESKADVADGDDRASARPDTTVTDSRVLPEHVGAQLNSRRGQDVAPPHPGPVRDRLTAGRPARRVGRAAAKEDSTAVATLTPAAGLVTVDVPHGRRGAAEPSVAVQAAAVAQAPAPVTGPAAVQAPMSAEPLSPLGKLLKLPGRLVNAVLKIFDITSSAHGPGAPISIAPINDLLFAAFREAERWVGLDRTPAPQPAIPTLTYTGPTTTPTPTVAQFLNAAASAYGLGTTPGGLIPFTVNGFQVSSVNILTGMAAKAWVTADQQIIISYQGTTGGTNLLFDPLIAVTQVVTDLQVIFTQTTPWAFYDALRFARRVQTAAAHQGYGSDDIFVTGHSLGGWEAEYVAQQIGLAGIGFESPGINTAVPGNGADSMFVNIETYGDPTPYLSTDLPGLQPFMPPYVPGGGSKPHYGSIVMVGDPAAMTPLLNATALWGNGLIGSLVFLVDFLGNLFQYHLPGVQAYHLDVVPDPGVVPWLGTARGPVDTGYGNLTIPQLLKEASEAGNLQRAALAA